MPKYDGADNGGDEEKKQLLFSGRSDTPPPVSAEKRPSVPSGSTPTRPAKKVRGEAAGEEAAGGGSIFQS
jgi:hypothetical protein